MDKEKAYAYMALVGIFALSIGYIAGLRYGREDEADAWRKGMLSVVDDNCRNKVREAMNLWR